MNSLPGNYDQSDVVLADLDADGSQDLIIAASYWATEFSDGRVLIMRGRGDGTFDTGQAYPTGLPGSVVVTVGDFNSDGRLDVATGNGSWRYLDTPCTGLVLGQRLDLPWCRRRVSRRARVVPTWIAQLGR